MEQRTTYHDKPGGNDNTDKTLALARRRADELGIKTVLVASTIGDTAVKAMDIFEGYRVIVVTHVTGFRDPDTQEFSDKNRQIVTDKGGTVLTAAHTFGGIQRALSSSQPPAPSHAIGDIVAVTLRTFGQGTKVALEIAAMAADAGLVRTDEEVISVAGTGRGADTAVVLKPVNTSRFFQTRVKEIICKPRL